MDFKKEAKLMILLGVILPLIVIAMALFLPPIINAIKKIF
jgi:hypothetical protein